MTERPYVGWLRVCGGPWIAVCHACEHGECFDRMHALNGASASALLSKLVLPGGQEPTIPRIEEEQ